MHGKAPVILIADDVKTNLLVLRNILAKEGFEVIEASDGMMPKEDRFQTCTKLKENPVTMDIPVIFVSALSETDDKVQGFSVGAVDCIFLSTDLE